MPVKPFQWTNLKKVSETEVHLIDSLFELLPATSARNILDVSIRKMLMKHLGEKSFYYLDDAACSSYTSFLESLPDAAILSVIGTEPTKQKVLVHIDNNLAFLIMDRLLGGQGTPSIENRPLSETEQGILQYLIMQVLSEIWRIQAKEERLHFRFERFIFSAADLQKLISSKEEVVICTFKVGIGEFSGFVRLVLTKTFVEKTSMLSIARPASEMRYFINSLDRYGYIGTTVWAEAGRTSLINSDASLLEEGDVILFDEPTLILKDGQIIGEADLKVGRGEEASLKVKISSEGKFIKCTVIGG